MRYIYLLISKIAECVRSVKDSIKQDKCIADFISSAVSFVLIILLILLLLLI